MSRFSFSSLRHPHQEPLLPQHNNDSSLSLQDLSPRASVSPHSPNRQTHTRHTSLPSLGFYPSSKRNENGNTFGAMLSPYSETNESYHDYNPFSSPTPPGSSNGNDGSRSRDVGGDVGGLGSEGSPRHKKVIFEAPPPPIARGVVFLPTNTRSANGTMVSISQGRRSSYGQGHAAIVDPLLALERKQKALEREVQFLLDRQGEGLVRGVGGEESESGSSTPTVSAYRSQGYAYERRGSNGGVVPVRQPKKKHIGLRAARRGLLKTMGDMILVKGEEERVVDLEIGRRENVLSVLENWESKIRECRLRIEDDNEETGQRGEMQDLKTEELALDNEIRELEDRLAQMRARRRWLGERIREGVNRREASVSSFKGELREVEREVREFLKRPGSALGRSLALGGEEEGGLESLPVGRRTLGIAKEWCGKEVQKLKEKRTELEIDRSALEEGKEVWELCMGLVNGFEDELRREMGNGGGDERMLEAKVKRMGEVLGELESKADLAVEKGWRLLICMVGAEVEAFREGEGILRGALEAVRPSSKGKQKEQSQDDEDEDLFPHRDPFSDGDGDGDAANGIHELELGLQKQKDGIHELKRDESERSTVYHDAVDGEGAGAGADGKVWDDHDDEVRRSLERQLSLSTDEDEGPDLEGLMVDKDHRHE